MSSSLQRANTESFKTTASSILYFVCKTCKVILSLIHIPSAPRRSPGIPLCLFHHFLLAVFNYTGYFQPRRPMIGVYSLPRL